MMIFSIISFVPALMKYLQFHTWLLWSSTIFFAAMIILSIVLAVQIIKCKNKKVQRYWIWGWWSIAIAMGMNDAYLLHWLVADYMVACTLVVIPMAIIMVCSLSHWTQSMRWALASWCVIPQIMFLIFRILELSAHAQVNSAWKPAIEYARRASYLDEWGRLLYLFYALALASCAIGVLIVMWKTEQKNRSNEPRHQHNKLTNRN